MADITKDVSKIYFGFRFLKATPMTRQAYNDYRGWQLPADEDGRDDGYLVEDVGGKPNHPDHAGYISWITKAQFDKTYRHADGMTFGSAIEAMRQGHSVARTGWNGNGMFVYRVPANRYPAQTDVAKAYFGDGAMIPYNAYYAIKNVNETVSTWVPSINDCEAEDWQIVEIR